MISQCGVYGKQVKEIDFKSPTTTYLGYGSGLKAVLANDKAPGIHHN